MPQHHDKRLVKLQDLGHLGLDGFARCATQLVLLLGASATLSGDRVILFVFGGIFIR